ncbi:hypothetical protein ACFQZV_02040 [Microbacterium koreense]|uniref:Cell division protein FtsL n=1 Tax=Microbacterium koreense TaxID=323761 RepID=A0ABW2ZNA5_9MICO
MVQTTFDTLTRTRPAWRPTSRVATAIRTAAHPRRLLVALILTATAVGVLALQIAEDDLLAERTAVQTVNTTVESRLVTEQSVYARERLREADLRAMIAEQRPLFASTEGFLK